MGRASRNKQTMPCIARNTDGTRCARRIPIGTSPQLCHIHVGANIGTPFEAAEVDPMDVLRKDMRASEASVRVRAATELLAEERRRRAEREAVTESDRVWAAFLSEVTPEERAELVALTHQAKLIKYRVYQRCPEARPENYAAPIIIARSDMAPGTLYLHENGTVCEAGAWDAPIVNRGEDTDPVASIGGRKYYATYEELAAAEPDAMVSDLTAAYHHLEQALASLPLDDDRKVILTAKANIGSLMVGLLDFMIDDDRDDAGIEVQS